MKPKWWFGSNLRSLAAGVGAGASIGAGAVTGTGADTGVGAGVGASAGAGTRATTGGEVREEEGEGKGDEGRWGRKKATTASSG